MATMAYGESDQLVTLRGDVQGQVGCYRIEEEGRGALLMCSDGTVLTMTHMEEKVGWIWTAMILQSGSLLMRVDRCGEPGARRDSDVVRFGDGLEWMYAARDWEQVTDAA